MSQTAIGPFLLRDRRGNRIAEVRDLGVRLEGEGSWVLSGPSAHLDSVASRLEGVCERLGPEVLLIEFRNAIGRFKIPILGMIEVVSGKWNEGHFDTMLQDVSQVSAALPFSAGTSGSLPYDRSIVDSTDLLYHAFVYLRHVLSRDAPPDIGLLPAFRHILREPHRRLTRELEVVPISEVRRLGPADLIRILQRPGTLAPVAPSVSSPLADALQGRLPERVAEPRARIDFDTPENRFVKTFLRSIEAVLYRMIKLARGQERQTVFWRRIEDEATELVKAIAPSCNHALWRHVAPMTHLPANSMVLQQRRGYKQVFQAFVRLRLSSHLPLNTSELQDLLEVKDIALLYELWCFFKLVAALTRHLGEPSSAQHLKEDPLGVNVPWEFEVAWPGVGRLLYNPRYARGTERASYSVGLRPDIAFELTGQNPQQVHLFDAKFRVRNLTQMMDERDEGEAEERRGVFKRGDLYKMHAYRDAIATATSVWVLYPGTEASFYDVNGQQVSDLEGMFGRTPQGVGAIPLQPAGSNIELAALVRSLVAFMESSHV